MRAFWRRTITACVLPRTTTQTTYGRGKKMLSPSLSVTFTYSRPRVHVFVVRGRRRCRWCAQLHVEKLPIFFFDHQNRETAVDDTLYMRNKLPFVWSEDNQGTTPPPSGASQQNAKGGSYVLLFAGNKPHRGEAMAAHSPGRVVQRVALHTHTESPLLVAATTNRRSAKANKEPPLAFC